MVMRRLRKSVNLIFGMSLVLLLALVIGLVAPNFLGNRNAASAAALVDGQPVDAQEYSRVLTDRLERERQKQGGELNEKDATKIRRDILNDLIDEQLAVNHAASIGQAISVEEFRADLLNDPELKDDQGRFDESKYQRVLEMQAEQGLTWQQAEDNFQRAMLLNKIRSFWTCQAVLTPQEAQQAVARFNRQVRAKAAVWNLEAIRAGIKLTDDEVHSYYSEHKQSWAKPAQYRLRQIVVRQDFATNSSVARAKADALLAKIKAGADFKALAATENADASARKSGGDLGWVSRQDLRDPLLSDVLSRLKKGQVSDVLNTSQGFTLVKVEDFKEGFEPTFANSGAKAAKELGTQRAGKQASGLAYQALQAIQQGKDFDASAKAFGGAVVTTGWFGRDDAKALPALGQNADFAHALLTLTKGEALPNVVGGEKAVAVAELFDERAGNPPSKPEDAAARERDALQEARNAKAMLLYDAWLAQLHQKADIVDQSSVLASK